MRTGLDAAGKMLGIRNRPFRRNPSSSTAVLRARARASFRLREEVTTLGPDSALPSIHDQNNLPYCSSWTRL